MVNRSQVHSEIKNLVSSITPSDWQKIEYYYKMRCEFVHKRTTLTVTDQLLLDFKEVVERMLNILFGLKF